MAADWAISEKGRRAKYYRLTRAGKEALANEESKWERYVDAVKQGSGTG